MRMLLLLSVISAIHTGKLPFGGSIKEDPSNSATDSSSSTDLLSGNYEIPKTSQNPRFGSKHTMLNGNSLVQNRSHHLSNPMRNRQGNDISNSVSEFNNGFNNSIPKKDGYSQRQRSKIKRTMRISQKGHRSDDSELGSKEGDSDLENSQQSTEDSGGESHLNTNKRHARGNYRRQNKGDQDRTNSGENNEKITKIHKSVGSIRQVLNKVNKELQKIQNTASMMGQSSV